MVPNKFFKLFNGTLLAVILAVSPLTSASIGQAKPQATASLFTVNSTTDLGDTDVVDGVCLASNGKCTLRAAIQQANFTAGADTISLPAGTYILTRPGDDGAAVVGDLDITDNLTIQGAGSALTIVDGNGSVTQDRVFQVLNTAKEVSFSGMTIENGIRTATFDVGGGLLWDGGGGHLHITDVIMKNNTSYDEGGLALNYSSSGDGVIIDRLVVQGNSASSAGGGMGVWFGNFVSFLMSNSQIYSNTAYQGGGLYFDGTPSFGLSSVTVQNTNIYSNTASISAGIENHSGSVTIPIVIKNSQIHNNQAAIYGGGIGNYGVISISASTLDSNSAVTRGGGIYNYEGGEVDIHQSTLSGNSSQTGGAIYSELLIHNQSKITLTNSTLSGNHVNQDGGGIYAAGGQVKMYNATIVNNAVVVPQGTTYAGAGGGIYSLTNATIDAQNTLLADNTHKYQALQPVADDCFGAFTSLGFNMASSLINCSVTGGISLVTSGQLHMGPLKNNGGTTLTQAPLTGSPVIDAGQSPACLDMNGALIQTDQRGFRRPLGASCDIGAVEYSPYAIMLPVLYK